MLKLQVYVGFSDALHIQYTNNSNVALAQATANFVAPTRKNCSYLTQLLTAFKHLQCVSFQLARSTSCFYGYKSGSYWHTSLWCTCICYSRATNIIDIYTFPKVVQRKTYHHILCQKWMVSLKVHILCIYSTRILIFVTPDDCRDTISLSSSPEPGSPEFTSWVDDLGLSVADERLLVDGKWLTATHISAANSLLRSQFPSQNGLHDTCILKERGIRMSDSDGFVQIVHVSPGHWACLSNKFSSEGNVELFDSLHTVPEEGDSIIHQACSIVRTPEPSLTINVVNVGCQEGGSDCGLYAIAMAYDLCAGLDPVSKKYVQSEMRSHLHNCVGTKQLKPFLSTNRDVKNRTILSVRVEVHCKCRMPEEGRWMVCCDQCNIWYHEECVPVPPDVRHDEEDEVPWKCPGCETGIPLHICTL